MSVFRTKSIEQSMADTVEPEHELKKNLSALDLIVFGVGVIIGTGIFVLTGLAARDSAGPSVALSFVVGGIVCGLAAVCYAEFASRCRWPGRHTPSPTPPWASWSPGSSAGT